MEGIIRRRARVRVVIDRVSRDSCQTRVCLGKDGHCPARTTYNVLGNSELMPHARLLSILLVP